MSSWILQECLLSSILLHGLQTTQIPQSSSVEQLVTSHVWSVVVQPPSDLALKIEEAQGKWALSLPLKLHLAAVSTVYHPGLINVCPVYLDSLKLKRTEGGSLDGF